MYSCITLDNGSKHVLYLQVLIYCTYIAVLKCNFSIKKNGLKRYMLFAAATSRIDPLFTRTSLFDHCITFLL